MPLFPAYAQDTCENKTKYAEISNELLTSEAQLLASDNDEEGELGADVATSSHSQSPPEDQDYYLDCKLDVGNLRVSTLYYPGRPQYDLLTPHTVLGVGRRVARAGGAARRYYSAPAPPPDPLAEAELAQRTRAFRDMLADNPADEELWLHFIDFQEWTRDADAALSAASEAAAQLRGSRRVRAALHAARTRALPPHRRLDLLRADLAALSPGAGEEHTELWLRCVDTACCAGGAADLLSAARAALAATRAQPLAYPHLLYAYGGWLRAAGLWERLVLLLELVTSMNFPPAAFPPPVQPERLADQERHLQDLEDKVIGSGLPLSTVWVRVERARAAAHWRPQPAPSGPHDALDPRDPQRAPQPADVADLLLPATAPAAPLLLVQALRLAKVPLLPCSAYALALVDGGNAALGDAHEADCAETLLALFRAARRLPAAHPARAPPAVAARLLALLGDPPHYFSDDAGYLTWVSALWDAACEWLAPEQRVALLCWRLRWLHALLLLLDMQEEAGRTEARRIRAAARAALKRFAGASPLPYAHFARIERCAAPAAAPRAALHALRAPAAPHERLYVARVLAEVCDTAAHGAWATACAALDTPLPPDERLAEPPPPELLQRALLQCEERCAELQQADGADGACVLGALLPAPAEWAAARARLASPARRAQLVREVRAAPPSRYWEQSACALVEAAARDHRAAHYARALAPLYPHNAFLALACGGAPLWAWGADGSLAERLRGMTVAARSHRAALAHALPALVRAARGDWAPGLAARAAAACGRAGGGGAGGALLHAARLESEARASQPRVAPALYAALDQHPHHKWLPVRGAAWLCAAAPALADVLLERELRAHALLDELVPPHTS